MVQAVNVGRRLITIQEAGIILRNREKLVFTGSGTDVPKELAAGQSFSTFARADEFVDSFHEASPAYPYCRDAEDRMYKGRFHRFFWHWYHKERKGGQ